MEPDTKMNPEIKPEVTPAEVVEAEKVTQPKMNVKTDPGTLSTVSPNPQASNQQWRTYGEQLAQLLAVFPERLGEVFEEYKQPLTTVGIALAAVPFVILTVAILRVVNAIPLFAPTFELVGFGYSAWFVYRYLLFAETRRELLQDIEGLKHQVTGKKDS
jgi:hypothetical protein